MEKTIGLRLFATLEKHLSPGEHRVPIHSGDTVQHVLTRLGVPVEEAKLVFVDGAQADLGTSLRGGERVGVFPPIGGG